MNADIEAGGKQAEKWRVQGRDALLRWQVDAVLEREDDLDLRKRRQQVDRQLLPWALWILLDMAMAYWIADHAVAAVWKWLLAAAVIPPMTMLGVEVMRALSDLDELQRRIELTALALTGMLAMGAVILLLMLKVLKLPLPPMFYTLPLGVAAHRMSRQWSKRHHQ